MNLAKLTTVDLRAKIVAKTIPADQMKDAKALLVKREAKSKAAKPKGPLTEKQKANRAKPKTAKAPREQKPRKIKGEIETIEVKGESVKAYHVGKMHDKRNGYTYNRYRLVAHPTRVVHKKIDGPKKKEDFI